MKISVYDKLHGINYQVVQEYIENGTSVAIPEKVKLYIEQLDLVRSMYQKYKSKQLIINTIMKLYPEHKRYSAELVYYDSINLFNLNNNVKKEAWKNFYAERLENAALVAWEQNDLKTYRELVSEAAKMRGVYDPEEPEMPPALKEKRPVIITIQPEDVGIEPASRSELEKIINDLDMPEHAKDKAKRESGVSEIKLFENDNEQENQE